MDSLTFVWATDSVLLDITRFGIVARLSFTRHGKEFVECSCLGKYSCHHRTIFGRSYISCLWICGNVQCGWFIFDFVDHPFVVDAFTYPQKWGQLVWIYTIFEK